MKKGITRRWLVNGFGVIALLILVMELAIGFALRSYCYRNVEMILSDHAVSHAELFSQYTDDAAFDFEVTARDFAESFSENELFLVILLFRE